MLVVRVGQSGTRSKRASNHPECLSTTGDDRADDGTDDDDDAAVNADVDKRASGATTIPPTIRCPLRCALMLWQQRTPPSVTQRRVRVARGRRSLGRSFGLCRALGIFTASPPSPLDGIAFCLKSQIVHNTSNAKNTRKTRNTFETEPNRTETRDYLRD